jgi:hypothetical protein
MILHQETHPGLDVDGCFACRIAGVQISTAAQGRYDAVKGKAMDKSWSRDHDAYRRMKRDGVQPRHLDGAARVEATADHVHQVTGAA